MNLSAHLTGLLFAGAVLTAAQPANYQFRTFAVCAGCATAVGGINDEGLAGAALIAPNFFPVQGYVFDTKKNTATAVPGTLLMTVPADNGMVPGAGFGPGAIVPFVLGSDGTVKTLGGYPGAGFTSILQFNRNGWSVGSATQDFATWFSFLRSPDGVYTPLVYPGAVDNLTLGTFLLGWSEAGTMVGYLTDPTETQFAGVIRGPDDTWAVWRVPGATATIIYAITESGAMAGTYQNASGWHGFVWWHGDLQTVDFPGAANTTISGLNNHGELVGFTFTGASPLVTIPRAFVATPDRRQ
jgi:hypothetical protein